MHVGMPKSLKALIFYHFLQIIKLNNGVVVNASGCTLINQLLRARLCLLVCVQLCSDAVKTIAALDELSDRNDWLANSSTALSRLLSAALISPRCVGGNIYSVE